MEIPNQTPRRPSGFTQADLNALISILFVLIILVSAGLKADRVAGTVGCQRKLGELAATMAANAQDTRAYDLDQLIGYSPGGGGYRELMYDGCPNAARPPDWQTHNRPYANYGYNRFGIGVPFQPQGAESLGLEDRWRRDENGLTVRPGPVSADAILQPSRMIAWGDAIRGVGDALMDGGFLARAPLERYVEDRPNFRSAARRIQRRHSGDANIAFADGHVESISLHTLFADDSNAALSLWNRDHQPHRERLEATEDDPQAED